MIALPTLPLAESLYNQWAALGLLFVIAALFAASNVIASELLGPRRKGKVKETPYESGVNPLGDTKQRFNVRFYLVAMIFLVLDVEILFLIPWVTIFKSGAAGPLGAVLLGSMLTFVGILLLSYIYAWAKGVLKWD